MEIGREALVVIGGAIVAAFVIGMFPGVREWIKKQWGDAPRID
jgi:uncharacterized protein YneF (UPF0154 family)